MHNVIEMQHITKRFPGIVANDDVNFTLRKGEIHALLGENGAGKSTLMSILFGMYIPEEGKILKDGKPIQILNPNDANAYGIGMVHQHFKLVEVFSILDNIIMGVEPNKFGFIKRKEAKEHILELCKQYELLVDVDAKIQDVSVGMQQRTEILKMLYRQNDILIFDEPTAVLTPQEIKQLMVTMKNLINEGKSIIFITHKLDEIMEVSDRVTVLRRGKVIGTVETSKTTKEDLSRMMVGRDVVFEIDKKAPVYGETALEVNNLIVLSERTKKHVVDNVSFKVRKGEIVCVAGVDGNGLSHIPEDRHKHGLILQDNLANNLALKKYHLLPYQNHGIIQPQPINELADELIKKYDIRSGQGVKTRVGSMSGGNQQKAIIAREIDKGSDVLLSIQTVRGLDVGAVEFAHRQLIKARDEGKAILMISFELDEVMSVSDRILVMYDGQIVKNVLAKDITVEELGLYMAGVKREEDVMTLPDVRKVKEEQNHE